MHFVVFSPNPHNMKNWTVSLGKEPLIFESSDDFIKAEYDCERDWTGTSAKILIERPTLTLSTPKGKLLSEAKEVLESV